MGAPCLNVPGFYDNELPLGIQIVGRYHDDLGVLQMAYAFEQATKVGPRRPKRLERQNGFVKQTC